MKRLVFILALLPTLLFAQQDSTKQTFKIGECRAYLSGCYTEQANASLSIILKKPTVTVRGCGDSARVIGFTMSTGVEGAFRDEISSNDSLSAQMITNLSLSPSGSWFIIKSITYKTPNGLILHANGMAAKLSDSKEDLLLRRSRKKAAANGITESASISRRAAKTMTKLTIQNGAITDKITHFEIATTADTLSEKVESNSDTFTPRMKFLMSTSPDGSTIYIKNVHILSNGKDCIIPGIILTIDNLN